MKDGELDGLASLAVKTMLPGVTSGSIEAVAKTDSALVAVTSSSASLGVTEIDGDTPCSPLELRFARAPSAAFNDGAPVLGKLPQSTGFANEPRLEKGRVRCTRGEPHGESHSARMPEAKLVPPRRCRGDKSTDKTATAVRELFDLYLGAPSAGVRLNTVPPTLRVHISSCAKEIPAVRTVSSASAEREALWRRGGVAKQVELPCMETPLLTSDRPPVVETPQESMERETSSQKKSVLVTDREAAGENVNDQDQLCSYIPCVAHTHTHKFDGFYGNQINHNKRGKRSGISRDESE